MNSSLSKFHGLFIRMFHGLYILCTIPGLFYEQMLYTIRQSASIFIHTLYKKKYSLKWYKKYKPLHMHCALLSY